MKLNSLTLVVAALGFAGSLNAALLNGAFNITGSVNVTATKIDWLPLGGTNGAFCNVDPSTGSFAGISGMGPCDFTGLEKDLTNPPTGVNTPVFVGSFLSGFTSPAFTTLFFDLTFIRPSTAPVCTGAEGVNVSCSAGPFPNAFTLKNTGSGVEVDLAFDGFFQLGADLSTRTLGLGLYTTQLVGQTISGVLAAAGTPGGFTASYSANYATAIPEPGTVSLMLVGLALVGVKFYRPRR